MVEMAGISPYRSSPLFGYFPYSEERTRKVCSKRLRFPHVPIPIGTHLHLTKMAPKKVLIFKQVEMAGISPYRSSPLFGYFPYSEERTRKVCSKRLRFPHVPIPIGTHLHLTKMAPKKVLIFKQVEMAGIEPACKRRSICVYEM